MARRRRAIYILAAIMSAGLAAGLIYTTPHRAAIAKYQYRQWYDTAASMADLVAAAWKHGWIPIEERTANVISAVELRPSEMHEHAWVDFENRKSFDAWGKAILMVPTWDDSAVEFVSFGPNQRNDRGADDDIVVNCTRRSGCQ